MALVVTWADFAGYLRRIREVRGLSQRQLGKLIRCSEHHVWRLEKGDRHPSKALLQLLRERYLLQPEDERLFDAFGLMIEYKCDRIELESVVSYLPVQRGVERCATRRRYR